LGLLQFIIYITDRPDFCNKVNCTQNYSRVLYYADDTKLLYICNVEDKDNLQSDTQRIRYWPNEWLLKLMLIVERYAMYGMQTLTIHLPQNIRLKTAMYLRHELAKLDFFSDFGVSL